MNKTKVGVLPRSTLGIEMLPGSPLPRSSGMNDQVPSPEKQSDYEEELIHDDWLDSINKPERGWIFVRRARPVQD